MKMWKKIIMDFLAPSHLSKSVRVTGSKIGYIPPALRIWKGSVDVFDSSNKEMIWTTIITSMGKSREFIPTTAITSSSNSREFVPTTVITPLSKSREFIPVTVVSALASSSEVGGV